jgi:hypothetical protein
MGPGGKFALNELRERVSWTVRKAELEPEEVTLFSAVNRYE